ncbi:MAG: hypothetical protein WCI78_01085 [Mycobacterium sp.]
MVSTMAMPISICDLRDFEGFFFGRFDGFGAGCAGGTFASASEIGGPFSAGPGCRDDTLGC